MNGIKNKDKGWRGDSKRHSMSARGLKNKTQKQVRTVKRDKKMPTFLVEMWNPDNYTDDWEDMPKHIVKRQWAGRVEFVNTGEQVFFRQVSELLKFIEDRRVR